MRSWTLDAVRLNASNCGTYGDVATLHVLLVPYSLQRMENASTWPQCAVADTTDPFVHFASLSGNHVRGQDCMGMALSTLKHQHGQVSAS